MNDCSHPRNRLKPCKSDPTFSTCEICNSTVRSKLSHKEVLNALHELSLILSPSHRRFAEEYTFNGGNGTQAYLTVFFTKNSVTAASNAYKLLKKAQIQSYIDLLKLAQSREVLDHMTVTKNRILDEEAKLAFLDIRLMFNDVGELLPLNQWPEELARAVDSVEIREAIEPVTGQVVKTFKYKFNNKGQALQRLQKCLGMQTDVLEHGPQTMDKLASLFHKLDGQTRGVLPMDQEEVE